MQRTVRTRDVSRGLKRIEPNENVLVAYAAKDGTVAKDGDGRNSPFTTALLQNIEKPGLEISFLFRNVRDQVMAATKREQMPFVYGSLSGAEIYLVPPLSSKPVTEQPKPALSPDELVWDLVKGSDVAASFEEFLKRYPGSARAADARAKLKALKPEQSLAAAPPASVSPASASLITAKQQERLTTTSRQGGVQRAILYEENPNDPMGASYEGTVQWRSGQASKAKDSLPTIIADISIPDRKLKVTLALSQNNDTSLPASHVAELSFTLPKDFPGGGISNSPAILMKANEKARGKALAGLAVKVTDEFFLIGLSKVASDLASNVGLLKEQMWLDIPLVYSNQRRAILAIEKGEPGKQTFAEAFKAWGQ